MAMLALLLLLLFPILAWGQAATCVPGGASGLQNEFNTDPAAVGYNTCGATPPTYNDTCVLNKFNASCSHATCQTDPVVSREKVYDVINHNELNTLMLSTTPEDKVRVGQLQIAMQQSVFNLKDRDIQQKLADIFVNSPITKAAIDALRTNNYTTRAGVTCSRTGTLSDVSCGLRGQGC